MTNFKIIRTLNKGAFAHVYEVLEMFTGRTLALKIVFFPSLTQDVVKNGLYV
jgi:serine/threonine protein kinase